MFDGIHPIRHAQLVAGELRLDLPQKRFLALDRTGLYWCRSKVGTLDASHAPEVQFLLQELEDGRLRVVLPLVDGDLRATLRGRADGWDLVWSGGLPGDEPEVAFLLCVYTGTELYPLIRQAMEHIHATLGTFRFRSEKRVPAFLDDLFWCTWDAFYRDLDADGVRAGLQSFLDLGLRVKGMVLDDGWLDHRGERLNRFEASEERFPDGLARTIIQAQETYGLEWFGIWHAFMGYWAGVSEEGELADRYRLINNRGNIRPWQDNDSEVTMVHPDDVHRLYRDWHRFLAECGVSMIKVDGQSSLEVFSEGHFGRVSTMAAYQAALQGSAHHVFEGNLIHCMPHGSDLVYAMHSSIVIRGSDDYFPKRLEGHGRHLWWNATNALWMGEIAILDWDMFWTQHPQAEFHAAARALSGGPIYFSDPPGQTDVTLLRRVALPDGRVLRPERPAFPTVSCVFADPTIDPVLLVITNRVAGIGLVGAFNCRLEEATLRETVHARMVHDLELEDVAAYRVSDGALIPETAAVEVAVGALGWEVVVFAPYLDGWLAPIGLTEMFAPPTAFGRSEVLRPGSLRLELKAGGRFVFVTRADVKVVYWQGEPAEFSQESGRLEVLAPGAGSLVVER